MKTTSRVSTVLKIALRLVRIVQSGVHIKMLRIRPYLYIPYKTRRDSSGGTARPGVFSLLLVCCWCQSERLRLALIAAELSAWSTRLFCQAASVKAVFV